MSGVRVEGLNLLVRNLRKLSKDYPKEMKKINQEVVEPVVKAARGRVNSKSGRLRDSIRSASTQKAGRVAAGKAAVPYAGVNHYGWPAHNIQGNPFLSDAINSKRKQVVDDYDDLTGKFIEKVWVNNY